MVWVTAALIGLGGMLGGFNTAYAAMVSRIRELATLQTLGFSRLAILINLIAESVLIAAAGAVVATVLAVWVLDGVSVRVSMGAFALAVDAPVVAAGLGLGLVLGCLGALPPAWKCLRPPIRDALYTA
jgi:ABC-type antimicrobial peptide transport system permease subunit